MCIQFNSILFSSGKHTVWGGVVRWQQHWCGPCLSSWKSWDEDPGWKLECPSGYSPSAWGQPREIIANKTRFAVEKTSYKQWPQLFPEAFIGYFGTHHLSCLFSTASDYPLKVCLVHKIHTSQALVLPDISFPFYSADNFCFHQIQPAQLIVFPLCNCISAMLHFISITCLAWHCHMQCQLLSQFLWFCPVNVGIFFWRQSYSL